MRTFQDLEKLKDASEEKKMEFVLQCINEHKSSEDYKTAVIAQEYDRRKNTTICRYQRVLYSLSGNSFVDEYSPNHKMCSGFFPKFVTQQNQYLLGNGVQWSDKETVSTLIGKDFDSVLNDLGRYAIVDGVSYGFFDLDHVKPFRLTEFAPLLDTHTGALRSGVRFWRLDNDSPLRATLYEEDGFTEYIWEKDSTAGIILQPKRAYVIEVAKSEADGEEIRDGHNYKSFPIIPLYCNKKKQSEIVGFREDVDCYDIIKAGFANSVDESSIIYWTVQNAGGMGDIDLIKLLDKLRKLHAANVGSDDDGTGAKLESHTIEAPYESREALLTRLENDMYDSYGALNLKAIIGGANTATQIRAAYIPVDDKADEYEYCILVFLEALKAISGIDEDNMPTFTRNVVINKAEEISNILSCATFLPQEYIVKKLLAILGDMDLVEEIMELLEQEGSNRFGITPKE